MEGAVRSPRITNHQSSILQSSIEVLEEMGTLTRGAVFVGEERSQGCCPAAGLLALSGSRAARSPGLRLLGERRDEVGSWGPFTPAEASAPQG